MYNGRYQARTDFCCDLHQKVPYLPTGFTDKKLEEHLASWRSYQKTVSSLGLERELDDRQDRGLLQYEVIPFVGTLITGDDNR